MNSVIQTFLFKLPFPLIIFSRISRIIYGKDCYCRLCSLGHHNLAVKIAIWRIHRTYRFHSNGPIIFIAGVARVGKTLISKSIASEYNFGLVSLDHYRVIWNNSHLSSSQSIEIKKSFLSKLIKQNKYGLIVEGDELITNDQPDLIDNPTPHTLTISYLEKLAEHNNVKVYVLGNANLSIQQKVDSILDFSHYHHCWASENLSFNEIVQLSRSIIRMSEKLFELTKNTKINYLEISSNNFNQTVNKILNEIKTNHL